MKIVASNKRILDATMVDKDARLLVTTTVRLLAIRNKHKVVRNARYREGA